LVPLLLALGVGGLSACDKAAEGGSETKAADQDKAKAPTFCHWDEDCAVKPGFICNDGRCEKGERTAEQKAAIQALRDKMKAEEEAKAQAKAEAERPPGPNEGRLWIRVCPFFKRTAEAVAEITATNKSTGQKYSLHLESVTQPGEIRSEFAFPKVPVGDYDVVADYGIRVTSTQNQVARLKCDKKAKPCREGTIREISVVPIAQEPAPKVGKDGQPEHRPCDWIAE
jgi:hypothetical protein